MGEGAIFPSPLLEGDCRRRRVIIIIAKDARRRGQEGRSRKKKKKEKKRRLRSISKFPGETSRKTQ
jgi:hypothetical protein